MTRQTRGRTSYHAGLAAEDQICADYVRRGFPVERRRWRGAGGEIDVILRDGAGLIFVEVKQSRSFDIAAQRVSARQADRIRASAEEYLATMPHGNLTDIRIDVALVNGQGEIRIIENAFL